MGAGGGAKEELRREARRPGLRGAGVGNGEGAAAMLAGAGGVLTAGLAAVLAIVLMTFSSGLAEALPFTSGWAGLTEGLAALTAGLTTGLFLTAALTTAGFADFTGLATVRGFAAGAGFLAAVGVFLVGTGLALAITLAFGFATGLAAVFGFTLADTFAEGAGFLAAVLETAGLAGFAVLVIALGVVLALPADAAFPAGFTATLVFFA